MKKFIKYFFIIVGLLLVLLVLLIVVFANLVEDDSSTKEDFSHEVVSQLAYIYRTKGHYPKSLEELPLYADEAFRTYTQNNGFHYSLQGNKSSTYVLSWRGGAMGWTGYHCTNDTSDIAPEHDGIVRTYSMPHGVMCTVTDLH